MRTKLGITLFMLILISCKKSNVDIATPNNAETVKYIPKDSCSYTIDGITYTCDIQTGNSGYVAGTNYNLITQTWAPTDTALYSEGFSIHDRNYLDGAIEINFSEKRILSKIGSNPPVFDFPLTRNDSSFYKIRSFGYATDFKRFNNKEGVAFSVYYKSPSYSGWLYSYITKYAQFPTTISDTCQNNSTFQIVKTFKAGYFNYVEAKFSANVYNINEEEKKLTNGYIRFSY